MAASDYDFSLVRNEIVARSLLLCGARDLEEPPTAAQLDEGVRTLNSIVKAWQSEHVYLWTLETITVPLLIGVSSYSLGIDPPFIVVEQAYLRINNDDNPVKILSFRDFQEIPDKQATGDPSAIAPEPTGTTLTVHCYPIPSQPRTLFLLGIRAADDWDSTLSTGGFSEKWKEALTYELAARLGDVFLLPINERRELKAFARQLFLSARRGDREKPESETVKGAY